MTEVCEVVRGFVETEIETLDSEAYPLERVKDTSDEVFRVLENEELPHNFYELGCLCSKIDPALEDLMAYRIDHVKPQDTREAFRATRSINLVRASVQRKLINYLGEQKIGNFTAQHWTNAKPGWGKTKLEVLGNCRAYMRGRLGFSDEAPESSSAEWEKELKLIKDLAWADLVLNWGMKGVADTHFDGKPEALIKAVFKVNDSRISKEKKWVEMDDSTAREEIAKAFLEEVGVKVNWPIIPPKGSDGWRQHVEAFLEFNDYQAWSRKHKFQQAGKKILGEDGVINRPQAMVAEVVGSLYGCKDLLKGNDFSSLDIAARTVFLRSAFDAEVYTPDEMKEGSYDWFKMRLWVLDYTSGARDFVKQRLRFSGQAFAGPKVSPPELLEAAFDGLKITEENHFSRSKLADRRKDPLRTRSLKPAFSSKDEPLPYMVNGERELEMAEDLFFLKESSGFSKKEIDQRRERFCEGFLLHANMRRFFLPGTDKKFLLKKLESFDPRAFLQRNILNIFECHVLGLSNYQSLTPDQAEALVLELSHTRLPGGSVSYLTDGEISGILSVIHAQSDIIHPYGLVRFLWEKLKDRGDAKYIFVNRLVEKLRS